MLLISIRDVDKVDATMAAVNEQRAVADEIADIISNPVYGNTNIDEVSHTLHGTLSKANRFSRMN